MQHHAATKVFIDNLVDLLEADKVLGLAECDAETSRDFCSVVHQLRDNVTSHPVIDFALRTDHFISLAYKRMPSERPPSSYWRRLYTDACILKALVRTMTASELDEMAALESIASLDHAIVIAGAPGDGRLEMVLDMIQWLQSSLPSRPPSATILSRDVALAQQNALLTSVKEVPSIAPPSLVVFQNTWSRTPFVLRAYAADWPALNGHQWASVQYLSSVAGPGRIVPIEVGDDYRSDDWTQSLLSWDEFLAALDPGQTAAQPRRRTLYLAQHNLLTQFPALRDDIVVPDYVFASLTPPDFYPAYKPPTNDDQLVVNAWLGPESTVSPAHTDPFFNCYVQVVGRKTVWLAPPDATQFMYPYGTPAAGTSDKSHNPAANTSSPLMSNTSRVDVFPANPQMKEESQKQFPAFWDAVRDRALSVTLEPGDLLFFPPGWWHAMRSEDVSFSVSMWF
ncbi:hypothetical protein F5I97DRAFT_621915 [Phlebopus sp. FC_14]|nr:hypothetical protein F5I97DRAFT_621915 [Phlebopus sp. FC_14]